MPDRVIRAALLRSPRWNNLYTTEAQLLFVRLILLCDDFGVYDGRDAVIATQAYPLGVSGQEADSVVEMLKELHRAQLIIRFTNAGRDYIGIPQWAYGYRLKRDFPAPPINLDQRDLHVRAKYGKDIDWRSPPGSDEVSVLLGLDGRPLRPQPPEWRRIDSDYAPITIAVTARRSDRKAVTASDSPVVTEAPAAPVTEPPPPVTDVQEVDVEVDVEKGSRKGVVVVAVDADENLNTVTANPSLKSNGSIGWANGDWTGITEDQRMRWQSMFDSVSIPDQLDRAAAWLQANPKERVAVQRDHGEEAFIVRWLLRETRGRTVSAKGGVDA